MPRPVGPAQLQRVAEVINAPLPQILARILTELANSGVGPGLGLLCVGPGSHKTDPDDYVPFLADSMTIAAWLELWLAGTLQRPWAVTTAIHGALRLRESPEKLSAAMAADEQM